MSQNVKKYFGIKIKKEILTWSIITCKNHLYAIVVFNKTSDIESILTFDTLNEANFQTNKLLMEYWEEKKNFELIAVFQLSDKISSDTFLHSYLPVLQSKF
jgi:hypothetical protein